MTNVHSEGHAVRRCDRVDGCHAEQGGAARRGRKPEARAALVRALHGCPCHWGAWQALAALAAGQDAAVAGDLPRHWARDFHLTQLSLEAQENDEALGRLQARRWAPPTRALPAQAMQASPSRGCFTWRPGAARAAAQQLCVAERRAPGVHL